MFAHYLECVCASVCLPAFYDSQHVNKCLSPSWRTHVHVRGVSRRVFQCAGTLCGGMQLSVCVFSVMDCLSDGSIAPLSLSDGDIKSPVT